MLDYKKSQKLADPDMNADEIFKSVVGRINIDRQKSGLASLGTNNNCRRCTYAYELSRRGYDVKATKSLSGTGQHYIGQYNATHDKSKQTGVLRFLTKNIIGDSEVTDYASRLHESRFLGVNKIKLNTLDPANSIFDAISKNPNGARGELTCKWKQSGAHSMAWEIVKGRPVIFDCQTNTMYDSAEKIAFLANEMSGAAYNRLDTATINKDFLSRWVKNCD